MEAAGTSSHWSASHQTAWYNNAEGMTVKQFIQVHILAVYLMSILSTELLFPGFISHSFYPYFVPSVHVLPISCFYI